MEHCLNVIRTKTIFFCNNVVCLTRGQHNDQAVLTVLACSRPSTWPDNHTSGYRMKDRIFYFAAERGAKYCDEYVGLSGRIISQKPL